jgi:hypothetical protein
LFTAQGDGRGYDDGMAELQKGIIFALEGAPERDLVARALGHAIRTEADDLEALRAAVRRAAAISARTSDVDALACTPLPALER